MSLLIAPRSHRRFQRGYGMIRTLGAVLSVVVAVACNDSTAPPSECGASVSVTVGSGTAPVFNWTPTCRLFLVLVEDPITGGDQWGVESDSTNAIAPAVTYGTTPPGATKQLTLPTTLQAGHPYRVSVFRFTGPGHEDGLLIGQASFTP